MIISFEGGEGVGKTTHVARLCSYLSTKGLPWLSIREPGGSHISENIRSLFFQEGLDTMTELLLVLASRKQNIEELIKPGLKDGSIVVIDRFIDSTLVYQGIVGGLGAGEVRHLMEITGTWIEPDLTFVMDVDPIKALKRIKPGDRFEHRNITYHEKLRNAFVDLARDRRHCIINADRDREDVGRDIIAEVERLLER